MFQLTQPSGYFKRTLFFSPKSLCLFCPVRTLDTLWATQVRLGLGAWAWPWDSHAGTLNKSHQENRWQMYSLTLVQAWEEHLKPGYSLHGEACCPCLPTMRHWARCREIGCVCTQYVGLPSNSTRHSLPGGENGHQSCGPCVARPWNYRISNIKDVHNGGGRDLWCFTDSTSG